MKVTWIPASSKGVEVVLGGVYSCEDTSDLYDLYLLTWAEGVYRLFNMKTGMLALSIPQTLSASQTISDELRQDGYRYHPEATVHVEGE